VLAVSVPLFAIENRDVPEPPPTDVRKSKLPPLNAEKVMAGAEPVGTASAKFPEIVAVGEPEFTLIKPNFAEVVALPPIKRSTVAFLGFISPLAVSQRTKK
jgi:hypothetical protein